MNKNILRYYDIRGIYPEDINASFALQLGKAFGGYLNQKGLEDCLVGFDNRLSSPELYNSLIKGISEMGINIKSLGLVTTPIFYFAKLHYNIQAGIMVTASHNPKNENGFKISFEKYLYCCGSELQEFYNYLLNENYQKNDKIGVIEETEIKSYYLEGFKKGIRINRPIKVVVDCGNGTVSTVIHEALSLFSLDVTYINCESDGSFPNHHPDPSVEENMKQLSQTVLEENADCGIAFDGDGDRIGVVLSQGEILPTDYLMIIFLRAIASKINQKIIIYDVKCSRSLEDEIIKLKLIPMIHRTGAPLIHNDISKLNLEFGGEYSGHIFFKDRYHGIDDGLYAGLRFLEIVSNYNNLSSNLTNDINHYYSTPLEIIKVKEEEKNNIMEKIVDYCNEKNYQYIDIDGIKIVFDDGWALIRKSNTGPNLTIRFESKTEERLNIIKEEFMKLIK